MKDANYGCKDEGNDDGVSCQSVRQLVFRDVCDVVDAQPRQSPGDRAWDA